MLLVAGFVGIKAFEAALFSDGFIRVCFLVTGFCGSGFAVDRFAVVEFVDGNEELVP